MRISLAFRWKMRRESSSDVAASESEGDDPSITAVADEPAITRERAPEVQPGDLLAGRYQVEAIIGKGGSGVVLRAFDRVSATVVAVKVLKPGLTHDPRWEKRFQRELRLGRPIRHPNVCRIFDIGDADGYRFLTMEFATGGTLRDLVKKNQPLRPLPERLADAAGVIAGLTAIHSAGIVHRDVKPDNMLRMEDGRLVLSDFGLATDLPDSTMVSVFVGTPHYMAPEVREGDPATTRSDVWSLGVVLHEIFFGKRPEKRSARSMSGVSKTSTASTSSTFERAMLALSTKCLANDPADRPEDARAVERLFETARRSPGAMLWPRTRRRLALGAVAAGAIALFGVGTRAYLRSRAPEALPSVRIQRLVNTGEPADWTNVAKVVASVPGHVHCFSLVDSDTVQVIWGNPRKAEHINVHSGARRPSSLVGEAYSDGCPDLSRDKRELLFTASTAGGGAEIRRSTNPEGRNANVVTPGWDPVWLTNGEEFAYSIDGAHAAVFSLPTMKFRLLTDPGLGSQQSIMGKSVSTRSDAVAMMFYGNDNQTVVAVHDGVGHGRLRTFAISGARNFRFAPSDNLFIAPLGTQSPLTVLDWRKGTFRNIGRYADTDLVDAVISGPVAAALARRRSQDVWLYDGSGKRRLTTDGNNSGASISPKGELLLVRPGPGSGLSIWWRKSEGVLKQMTTGESDTMPEFSPDGNSWVYVDYVRRTIMLCTTATAQCRAIRRDELLPVWPKFSPDGSKIAYVRMGAVSQVVAFSISDGREWALGGTHWQCPPVWSSPSDVWTFEGSAGRYAWVEKEMGTGLRTGRRLEMTASQSAASDDLDCWPKEVDVTSPFFRKVRVETEETSSILRLPSSELSN